ncbi:MAG: DUF11 domain-containing protein, partial [Methanobrevibacter sp.]|nr:DUF11 domain-containing protein [Methanobrevibacter sp.]
SLTVNKAANVTVVGNNTLVNFTIVVNNTGEFNATGITISDLLPIGFTFDSASEGAQRNGQTVYWDSITLQTGMNKTVWISARSNDVGLWDNVVTVQCIENNTFIEDNAEVLVQTVNATLIKTANLTVVGNNTLVNFTIKFNHTSLVNATNVVISDVLPDGFAFDSASADYRRDGQTVSWHFDTVKPGENMTFWIVARTNSTGSYTNTVTVGCDENSTIIAAHEDVEVFEVNVTLNKTANVTVVGNNTLVNFTIVVNNTALVNATNVTIRDVLPNGFVFEDAASGFERNGQIISWHFDCLQTGAIERLWIVARSNATGEWNNIVNASCDENSTILGNNATVSVVPVNLTVNKTANVTVIGNNTLVNFTIVVNNTGNVNATGIEIKDILPDGFEFVDASDASHVDGQLVYWDSVTIENGTAKTYWITAKSRQTGTFNNTVNVTSHENSTIVAGNASVEVVPVNLTVIKIATPNEIYVDELVNFTIRVKNNALVNATHVEITDVIDLSVFEIREYNGTLTQNDDGKLVWTIDLLAPGEMQEVWVVVKALHNATYVNSVNVTSSENRTASNNNTTVLVKPIVILTIEKTVNVGAGEYVGIFETVDFTVRITNTGLSNATNVVVTDVIPEGFAYSGCSADGYNPIDGVLVVPLIEPNVPYEFTISLTAMGSGVLTNVANVTCLENDTLRQDDASIEVLPLELILNKTANVTVVGNNTLVNFTIEINNTGLVNATYIYLRDVLPEGLIFVNATEGYSQDGQIITWDLEKLAHGSNTSYWIVVKTSDVGSYINNVSLYCAELLDSINDSAAINVVPVNLTVNKTASVSNASVGDEITFTINVTNKGQANATNIVVKDV